MYAKAIIDAHNDDESYVRILDNIKAILFLATPHRGANFAALLSKVLSISFSRKIFVEQLQWNSPVIAIINDYFRERSRSLELVSFSESTGVLGMDVLYP
jgi:hypothetical protein